MAHAQDEPGERPLPSYPSGPRGSPRPPLTKRMRPGHWMAIDFLVGAVAALAAALTAMTATRNAGYMLPLRLVLMLAVLFPVGLRRRGPVPAFCALLGISAIALGVVPFDKMAVLLAAAYVLYTVTVTTTKRTGAAALGLGLAVIVLEMVAGQGFPPHGQGGVYLSVAFAMVIAWMIGYSVRQRRAYAGMLQQQAASSAVAEERLRIARELHDVVAHSMSVIAVQAGYGQYVIDNSPAEARDALGAIQATSRDALEELRRMLGMLRRQDSGLAVQPSDPAPPAPAPPAPLAPAPLAPAPGLGDLDRLIHRTRGAGVHVSLARSGRVRGMPAGIDLSAYRIIQEALTNAVKHAGTGTTCEVAVCYGDDALEIRVRDNGGQLPEPVTAESGPAGAVRGTMAAPSGTIAAVAPSAGHGIIGMRERVSLCGGQFSAGPEAGGGFCVTATLPLTDRPAGNGAGNGAGHGAGHGAGRPGGGG